MNRTERPFSHAGFFALRTPLLPFDELLEWAEGLEVPRTPPDSPDWGGAVERDLDVLRARLRRSMERPEVMQALFVASPSLLEALGSQGAASSRERAREAELPLARYYQRMASRSTPFGLFAGCSVGTVGASTSFALPARAEYKTHTRLDMDYLFALCEDLAKDEQIRASEIYRPNSSLYRIGGRIRYMEARLNGKARTYHLVSVTPSPYVEAVLERAARGADRAALVRVLVESDPEVSEEEAREFVDELITAQLLVPELVPPVTGLEPVFHLIATTEKRPEAREVARALEATRLELEALDAGGIGAPPSRYRAIAEGLSKLPTKVELSRLFQVDTVKPARAELGGKVLEEIARGVGLLRGMARRRDDALANFRRDFSSRYEDREVPLLEALDDESGIGFDRGATSAEFAPLLEGLGFPAARDDRTTVGQRDAVLRRLLENAAGADELVLSSSDVEALTEKEPPPVPDTFGVMSVLVAESDEAAASGNFQLWIQGVPASGANLLGRFCHGDPALHENVKRLLRAEEALKPDAVFAEVVHLPQGRVGNVLCRPVLRDYEIPFLGLSGAPADRWLTLDDLMVSIAGDRVVLRSKRLGREVMVRMTNAHNHSHPKNLGVYRFLTALQNQGPSGVTWDWGTHGDASRLPRVRHGRLVLSSARWRMRKETLEALDKGGAADHVRTLRAWREQVRAPRFLALVDGDNELPVDFDNALSLEAFAQLVKKRGSCVLVEMPYRPEELFVRGPEGRFAHEIFVPFVRQGTVTQARPRAAVRAAGRVARSFPPGSEWLFFKLYAGPATVDRLLTGLVEPLVQDVVGEGRCDRWFFIRYGDPDWHLRLRFHGDPRYLREVVLAQVTERVKAHEGIWKIQLDTYEREMERYGGDHGIELAEQLFAADSEAVLKILGQLEGDDGAVARGRLALRGVLMLLQDAGLTEAEMLSTLQRMRASFGAEFRADSTHLKHQIAARYRAERKHIEELLDPRRDEESAYAPGLAALRARSDALRPVMAALRAAENEGRLSLSLADLLPSFAHMHANRMLRASARPQELVLYDFLLRHCESTAARRRKQGNAAGKEGTS